MDTTEYGLNRYDGENFIIYTHSDSDTLSITDNYIFKLYEDSQLGLIVGCHNGLCAYNLSENTFHPIKLYRDGQVISPYITDIIQCHDGKVLISTSGNGIFELDKESKKAIYCDEIMGDIKFHHFTTIFEDSNNTLWLATEYNGLIRYSRGDGEKEVKHFKYPQIADKNVTTIVEDATNTLMIGFGSKGVARWDHENERFNNVNFFDNNNDRSIFTLKKTDFGLLVGCDGDGLMYYNLRENIIQPYDLSHFSNLFNADKIHSILQDDEKNLWLGIFQKGVVMIPYGLNSFGYYGHNQNAKNPIGESCIFAMETTEDNTLVVGTDGDGLYFVDTEGKRIKHIKPSNRPFSASSILEDSNNNLWVGTLHDGLKYIPQREALQNAPINVREKVYALCEDWHKNIYVGTHGSGLYVYNLETGAVSQYATPEGEDSPTTGLANNWVNDVFCDNEGLLWIAHCKGLTCFNPQTKSFNDVMGTNTIIPLCFGYAVAQDHEGVIWVGTTIGLFSIDKRSKKIKKYDTSNGLPNEVICGICTDIHGDIWLSTYKGISKYSLITHEFTNFKLGDGLQGNEFTPRSFHQGKDGVIYFGGTDGITFFNPTRVTSSGSIPRVVITDISLPEGSINTKTKSGKRYVTQKAIIESEKLSLSYKDNTITISFSAFNFDNPEQITYRYRIPELSKKWISSEHERNSVRFNNLAPGYYNFEVQAINRNLRSDIKSIAIEIRPPWYLSYWALALYFIFIILVISFIIRFKIYQKKVQNEEEMKEAKLKFFIDISHEIRTPMTLIINPLEKLLAMDQDEKNHRLYLLMYRNAQRILHLVNQLMDTRKIEKGQMVMHYRMTDMIGFINDIKMTFEDLASKKGIKFSFEHPTYSDLYVWVDMQNFDKILMNLLSNAFKYTPDNGEITISITTGVDPTEDGPLKEYFEISVADTGIGINPDEIDKIFNRFYRISNSLTSSHSGTGIGLHLCKSLVELHKGRIWAENRRFSDEERKGDEEKKGAIFIVRLPLGADHIKEEDLEKGDIAFGNNSKNTFIASALEDAPIISDDIRKKARTNIRVLVVEDNPNINDYIRAELSDEFSITSCSNGAEALQLILNDTPDIVVSDIMMPVMDGLTLTKKIRHNANVNHLPIVLLTSRTSVQEKLEGLDIGADAYIEKPFNTEMLKSTIASIVETRRMLRNKFTGAQDQKEKVKEIQIKSSDEELMDRIMQVINNNISNSELSVEKLSEMVGLSRVHLYRKIKDMTSMTAHDFIRSIRLKQAMELLEKKDLSISDIAYATGFTTVSHFSTAFKSMYGASPSEYRNRQKVSNNSSEAEQTE